MRSRRALWLATVVAGCVDQTIVTPHANVVVVHAVIDASAKDQTVVVQTTTGAESQQRDVVGARVTITTPIGETLVAEQVRDTTPAQVGVLPAISTHYRIAFAQIGPVVPGGAYALHVVLPDGREVHGRTTVPDAKATSTSADLPDFDRNRDTLSLAWPDVRGASAFEVFVGSSRTSLTVFADTTVSVPGRAENSNGGAAFLPGLTHRVVVSAVDANYYDYYRRATDFFTGRGLVTHLDGAVGVFGSIVPVASYSFMVR